MTALTAAEAARAVKFKVADPQLFRIAKRTPQPLARARMHQQPVRVVHFRTPIVGWTRLIFTIEIHAGEWRDAELIHCLAREQARARLDDSGLTRLHDKHVGTRHARTIEQRVQSHLTSVGGGPFQPKLTKERKFFPTRPACVDRQAARGQPEHFALRHRPEITGAGKYHHVIEFTSWVERISDAKSGEAYVGRNLIGESVPAIGEQTWIEIHRLHGARFDGVQPHAVFVKEPRVN